MPFIQVYELGKLYEGLWLGIFLLFRLIVWISNFILNILILYDGFDIDSAKIVVVMNMNQNA